MADADEYIKYITERFVQYIETPKEERRRSRSEARSARGPWHVRWFGMAPASIAMWWNNRRWRSFKNKLSVKFPFRQKQVK